MNASMQRQYGNQYQQMTQRSPHTSSSSRRAQAPMNSSHTLTRQQQKEMEEAQRETAKQAKLDYEAAKRRAEKPTDKNMPEGVEDLIVGDGVQQYKQLREVERKLDAVMMRKKLELQDSLHNNSKKYRKLRIWISNTVENQPWQGNSMDENAFDFNMGVEATFRVKIEGRLVEEEEADDASEKGSDDEENAVPENETTMDQDGEAQPEDSKQPAPGPPHTKLSHFFKSITVDFDRSKNFQPDGTTQVEWKKPQPAPGVPTPPAADFDCLEFERKSDENINCTINFYRDETPERYHLSKELADVLDTTESDRASIVMGIWEYIKAMGLQREEEKRLIQCDDRLQAVFQRPTMFFPHIPTLIHPHLSPLPPLTLPYTIRVDPEYHASPSPTVYTITLPTTPTPVQLTPPITSLKQLALYDEHLGLLIQALSAAQRKHSFLEGYAKDPVTFVRRWMGSQKRDLEVVLGESGRNEGEMGLGGEWRRGGGDGVWGTEQVREGVGLLVQKAGRDGRAY